MHKGTCFDTQKTDNAVLSRLDNPSEASAGSAVMVVNENTDTVTVQAKVPQRDLLDYLANYV